MSDAIRRKVDFPLYLEVLKQLPEISDEDIAETEKVFEEIYDGMPNEVTFDVGAKKGDGEIYSFQRISDDAGRSVRTKLFINEYGEMNNPETGANGEIPWNVAKYLMSSLFGTGELLKAEYLPEEKHTIWDPSGGCIDQTDDFDPYWEEGECACHVPITFVESQMNSLITPHMAELSNGAWLLYEAALKKGSVGAKASSKGAEMIEGVKAQLMAKLEILTQEVWKDAEAIYSSANSSQDKSLDANEVKAVINKHSESKPSTPPLTYEQAVERYEAAVAMIKEVASTKTGKHFFLYEGFNCSKKLIEEKENQAYLHEYKCDYGVNGGQHWSYTIGNPWE